MTTVVDFLSADSNLYNAAKHGLAVTPSETSMQLGAHGPGDEESTDAEIALAADGPTLQYLDVRGERSKRRWQESTTWISPESNMGLTYIIAKQIEALMNVGRARYVGDEMKYQVPPITSDMVEKTVRAGRSGEVLVVRTMGISLLYFDESASK